ncbi:Protein of unknown function, partial [Cotesia congregata]
MWPHTLCYSWKLVSFKNTCRLPESKIWTIHGFWPAITQTTRPNYCSDKGKLNLDLLEEIQQELDTNGPNTGLVRSFSSQIEQRVKTLEIFNSFDVTKILTKAGFHAGGKYFAEDLIKSIESFTGKNCQIDCIFYIFKLQRQRKEYYLYQVKICFDKSFKPIDCSKMVPSSEEEEEVEGY